MKFINDEEKLVFLRIMYAKRAVFEKEKAYAFYQETVNDQFQEEVLQKESVSQRRFLEIIHLIENECDRAMGVFVKLQKSPENQLNDGNTGILIKRMSI